MTRPAARGVVREGSEGVGTGVRRPLGAARAGLARLAGKRSERSARGTAELSVLVAAGALVAGALFGTGLSRTSVDIGDGLTWFSDDPSGEVIQVNPATGRPETRIDVAAPGNELDVAQYTGRLIVTNRTTGQLTSFDLSSILTSGQRRVTPGAATDVLHHDDDVFLVDRERGTIAAIDPVSTDTVGTIWQAPAGLADAVVDGTGEVWALDQEGALSQLRWSGRDGAFVTEDERTVDHSGAQSVLVGHEQGVTVFGPDQGIVVQVGTGLGDEVVSSAPRLSGELVVPDHAPAGLVPVAAPQTGTVAIVSDGAVHEVDVTAIGCATPAQPEAFQGAVYVPCPGDDKVVRLDARGARAGDDIELPEGGGDPALVVDDGVLLINVPGSTTGVSIDQDGTVSTIVRLDDEVPAVSGDPADVPGVDPSTVDQVADDDAGLPPRPPSAPPTAPSPPPSGPTQTPSVCVGSKKQCLPLPSPTLPTSLPTGNPSGGPGSPTRPPSPSGTPWPSAPPSTPGFTPTGGPTGNPTGNPSGGPGDPGAWPTPTDPSGGAVPAPTGVKATQLQSGEVQVSWVFDTRQPVDGFTVQRAGTPTSLATVSAGIRQASVTVPPGTHQFTVTALKSGSTSSTSAPSAAIQTANRPGAPTKVTGTVRGSETDNRATVSVSWGAVADDGGSAVVDYTVTARDAFGTHTVTATGTTASYQVTCDAAYCDPGPVEVSVTARNARGNGPAATATLTYSGPEKPALPAGGAQLVTAADTTWTDNQSGSGTTTLTLAPPADWAGFAGTCTWTHNGNQGGADSGTVGCGARTLEVPINTGYLWEPDTGAVGHSITFTARTAAGEAVDSATYQWTTQQQPLCEGCQIP